MADASIVQQLVGQIPWGHNNINQELLIGCKLCGLAPLREEIFEPSTFLKFSATTVKRRLDPFLTHRIIKEQKPASLKELARVSGRKRSNLSRTLNTMSRYGIVDLVKQDRSVKPIVKVTDFKVEFGLSAALR